MITWIDAKSGAAMVFNTDQEGAITCAQPAFQTGSDFRGIATGFAPDPDGCMYCDPLLATQPVPGSDARPPFVFHLGNSARARASLAADRPVDLIVTGFAETFKSWRDTDEYRSTQAKDDAPVSVLGFVYDPARPSPSQYIVTAPVLKAEKRLNSATNVEFWWLWLRAGFGDSETAIVVREEDVPFGVEPGNVVEAQFWACAMSIG